MDNLPLGCKALSRHKIALAVSTALTLNPLALQASPTHGTVVSGSAEIGQSGSVTNINQHTEKATINWQGFSVGRNEEVNFHQPDSSAITLNRVLGNERSVIEGALNANGKIFLINSNGILFTRGSSVNAAGLVASTLNISNANFEAGRYVFQGSGGSGSVINMGTLSAADRGYVALLGKEALNQGVILATRGTAALSAGEQVTLNFNGDSLLSVTIDRGSLNALVENRKAIYADGGKVFLTARAADDLLSSQVNNSGLVEAQTLGDLKGEIVAHAYGGKTHIDGTLDASAPKGGDGGLIETSGDKVKITDTARITTQASAGKTGSWQIDPDGFTIAAKGGDMTGKAASNALENNNLSVASTQGKGKGKKGDINVNDVVNWSSHSTLRLTATRNININAPVTGQSGGLALSAGKDVNLNTPSSAKVATLNATAGRNVNINAPQSWTAPGAWSFSGNTINVNDTVSWSDELLTLNAGKFINVNAVMTASNNAQLVATYDTVMDTSTDADGVPTPAYGTPLGGINPLFNVKKQEFVGRIDFSNNTAATPLTINGNQYTLITSIGGSGAHDLSAIDANQDANFNHVGFYALATDLTAPSTAFTQAPVAYIGGLDADLKPIPSAFEGLGHAIRNLTINQQKNADGIGLGGTGLFGEIYRGSSVSNINLVDAHVTGAYSNVGTLVGWNWGGRISNAYASGTVNASADTAVTDDPVNNPGGIDGAVNYVGGLVGTNDGIIFHSGANVNVTTKDVFYVGGFAGINEAFGTAPPFGVILQSYAMGAVNAKFTNWAATNDPSSDIGYGGFVGTNSSIISNSSSSGPVTIVMQTPTGVPLTLSNIGGFAGVNTAGVFGNNAIISNSVSTSSVRTQLIGDPNTQGGLITNIGGFVGGSDGKINNSIALGSVRTNSDAINIGGFAGNNTGTASGNSFNSATTGQSYGIGSSGDGIASNTGASKTTASRPSSSQGPQPSSQAQAASNARAQAQALAGQAAAQRDNVANQDQTTATTASQLGSTRSTDVQRSGGSPSLANTNIASAATPPTPIDNNIVRIDPSSYSAHVQSIEVDGVVYDLDEEDNAEEKTK